MCDSLPFQKRHKQVQKTEKPNKKGSKNKQQLVERAIPNIVDAIKTVVSLSDNEDFRVKCFNLLKIKDERDFYKVLTEKLWKIANCRLDIKPAAEKESQIVPEDGARNRALSELPKKNNAVEEKGGTDYFDDLAGEITFYNSDNCFSVGHEVSETKDVSSPEQDSSFELLAELEWDSDHLPEENLPGMHAQDSPNNHLPDHTGACGKTRVSVSQETSYQGTSNPARETQCPEQQGRESSTLTNEMTDLTSPKAKLRCCKDASEPAKATTSSNGWQQVFSQDYCYSKILCVSASQQTIYQGSADAAQETQGPEQQGTNGCTLTKEVTDLTSPKAKLQCCKDALELTEAITSSNDWLQEFSQDCYWVAHNNVHEQQEAKQSLPTLNATLQACSEASLSHDILSQTVQGADDFDALTELSVI